MKPVRAEMTAPCPPARLFPWIEDLGRYPSWLDLVRRAEPNGMNSWSVVLTAPLGPLRRSKQLTMIRTVHEADHRVRFERREPDGKDHAAWILDAEVVPTATGSTLTMSMSYHGKWWGPLIERVLSEQIDAARPRLSALVADR